MKSTVDTEKKSDLTANLLGLEEQIYKYRQTNENSC